MKIGFFVFSGTGNTKRACAYAAELMEKAGHITKTVYMPCTAEIATDLDCIVLGYPVHAFNAPAPVLKFIKSMPHGSVPVYIMQTSGEALKLNTAATVTPIRMLRRRGYDVRGTFWYVMPYNIIFRHRDAMAARMWRDAKLCLIKDVNSMISGKKETYKVGVMSRFVSFVLKIEHAAMPLIGRGFKTEAACSGCGQCAAKCPRGNIVMSDDKPKFGEKCVGCMRCVFNCPENAISPSIFKGWRVNGAYDFDAPPAADDEICSFCKKSYMAYFKAVETGAEYARKKKINHSSKRRSKT